MIKTIFKRTEKKYQLSKHLQESFKETMIPYMKKDEHENSIITNIYFDNESYDVIRDSIEMPIYKEKLRIRCYEKLCDDATVFFEIKKKYDKVVYKRRQEMKFSDVKRYLNEGIFEEIDSQIMREIDHIRKLKNLKPCVMISYEREAFFGNDDDDFRVTFDKNIECVKCDEALIPISEKVKTLGDDPCMMEVKTNGGWPMWLTRFMSENKVFHKRYSKYGEYYKKYLYKEVLGGKKNA